MNPLTPEQQKKYFETQNTAANPLSPQDFLKTQQPITGEALSPTATPVVKPLPEPTIPDISTLPGTEQPEQSVSDLSSLEAKISGFDAESEVTAKTQDQIRAVNDINTQIRMHQADVLEAREKARKMGTTLTFSRGEEGEVARQGAIEAIRLSALAQAAQGNLDLADSLARRAVKTEFQQLEREVQVKRANIITNWDRMDDTQRNRAKETLLRLNAEDAFIKEKTAEKEAINGLGILMGQHGASMRDIEDVFNSGSYRTAIAKAAPYLQDPMAKQQLKNAELDYQFKKVLLKKAAYELDLLQKYGGMTPAQYADYIKKQQQDIAAAKDEEEKARKQGQSLDEKASLLSMVLGSSAIDSVVGPSLLGRASPTFGGTAKKTGFGALAGGVIGGAIGFFGGGVGAIPGAALGASIGGGLGAASSLPGSVDALTGSADVLIGQTEQFISQEFLDSLIDAKAQGATFGALTKPEQDALTAAATFIGQRRVCDGVGGRCTEGSRVIGYDMSEADFRREITTIQELTKKAYEVATGEQWIPPAERTFWENLSNESSTTGIIPGSSFYK